MWYLYWLANQSNPFTEQRERELVFDMPHSGFSIFTAVNSKLPFKRGWLNFAVLHYVIRNCNTVVTLSLHFSFFKCPTLWEMIEITYVISALAQKNTSEKHLINFKSIAHLGNHCLLSWTKHDTMKSTFQLGFICA